MILHIFDVLLHLRILSRTNPLNLVLMKLLNITDAFQDVCNVVYASLLHTQLPDSIIQINCVPLALFYQFNELSS